MTPRTAFGIALGSNVGDRRAHLEQGVERLLRRLPEARLTAGASLYEADPVDCAPGTGAFLNTVIEIVAAVSPAELHGHLVAVETLAGRESERERNAPRTLDLDLLYAGDYTSWDPALTVPHPGLHRRRFVLGPMAEIRPLLRLPGFVESVTELLNGLTDNPECVRIAGTWRYHRAA